MNTLGWLLSCAVWFVVGAFAHKIYVRRTQLRQRELDDAQQAAAILRGCVHVDGVDLPLPSAAWEPKNIQFDRGNKRLCLGLGGVVIPTDTLLVYVGAGQPMPSTKATEAYARAVWTAYRNRCARKAIEEAT